MIGTSKLHKIVMIFKGGEFGEVGGSVKRKINIVVLLFYPIP